MRSCIIYNLQATARDGTNREGVDGMFGQKTGLHVLRIVDPKTVHGTVKMASGTTKGEYVTGGSSCWHGLAGMIGNWPGCLPPAQGQGVTENFENILTQ